MAVIRKDDKLEHKPKKTQLPLWLCPVARRKHSLKLNGSHSFLATISIITTNTKMTNFRKVVWSQVS